MFIGFDLNAFFLFLNYLLKGRGVSNPWGVCTLKPVFHHVYMINKEAPFNITVIIVQSYIIH